MTASSPPLAPNSLKLFGNHKRATALLAVLAGLALVAWADRTAAQTTSGRLTSRPRPAATPAKAVTVGAEIRTDAGQRRRVQLPDGSILYVNAGTRATLETARRLQLASGEIYLEAADRPAQADTGPFVVRTPSREVSGRGASLAVRVAGANTTVLVTRGQAQLSGLDRPVRAGQRVASGKAAPEAAPRASHTLAWARELMIAAESPLVPASKHAGGALLVRDPNGQEASLELRKYHIDVHIEDGFARTTIDQTYFNSSPSQLEGTFYFPLPPDASLSRLAMYVETDGGFCQLMEGGMVEADLGRRVYETIRYANRDPALLEWLDGSTFKMRVFPLEGRKEKRLLLSYTQRLGALYGQTTYRFPAGHSLQTVRDWSFHARLKGGADALYTSPSHALTAARDGKDLVLDAAAKQAKVDRDVVVLLTDTRQAARDEGAARFSSAEQEQARYLMVRYRPELTGEPRPRRRDWVFLFESSGDRDPLLARVQIDVIRHLLAQADPEDTFRVLAAGTRVRPFAPEARQATPDNLQAALAFLEQAHLVGALDLGKALSEAAAHLEKAESPYLVHVGSGIAALGERRQDVLVGRLPAGTRYVGVGVGRRWNRSLMKAAAERTGGLFTQVNPDEPVAWRAFDLFATLNTPRLLNVSVADADTGKGFLCHATALAQGEELCAVTRVEAAAEMPRSVVVRGTLAGKPYEQILPVRAAAAGSDYLPRTWAKLEIERLLAEDAIKHRKRIVELSKAMYVMTPFTSLLVLENDDLYTQYKVDRGRKDHWAMYAAPAKIPVVYEPDPEQPDPKLLRSGQRMPARHVMQSIVVRTAPRMDPSFVGAGTSEVPAVNGLGGSVRPTGIQSVRQPGSINEELAPGLQFAPSNVTDLPSKRPERVGELRLLANFDPHVLDHLKVRAPRLVSAEEYAAVELTRGKLRARSADHAFLLAHDFTPFDKLKKSADKKTDYFVQAMSRVEEPDRRLDGIYGPLAFNDDILRRAKGSAVDVVAEQLTKASREIPTRLYERPTIKDDPRRFSDLLSYASGMNTNAADMEAVLEAEALSGRWDRPGKIDAAARVLLKKARATGWQAWTLGGASKSPVTVMFDGKGRYAYERTYSPGIKERVNCDGKTLLHLYPQLGLGARRTVSRFHRADFAGLVPWAVPPAADLARGADVKVIGERTVAIIPRGAMSAKTADGKPMSYARVHLIFREDGPLAERQLIRMPKGEVLLRQVCSADGVVRLLDGKGKELLTRKGKLAPAQAPDLKPDMKPLVVLPLPYRTPDHVRRALKIEKKAVNQLRFDEALPLFAAAVAASDRSEAFILFRQVFRSREQRQLGFYVLLAACGVNLDAQNADVLAEHLDEPVAQYLALHSSPVLRAHASQWAVGSGQWGAGALQHLAVSHALLQRWQTDKVLKSSPARVQAEVQRALDYVHRNKGTAWGWALLCLMQDRAGKDKALHTAVADCFPLFEDVPGLGYAARYEQARSLWKASKQGEARERFEKLYADTLKQERLPAIDGDFRVALAGDDRWGALLRGTADRLVKDKRRPAVLALAWQCWQLEDRPLANHLLATALHGVKDDKERLAMDLVGLQFLQQTGQLPQADALLKKILDHKQWGRHAALWRLAATLAERRDLTARALECLETALELEYAKLPEVLDLQAVRRDYAKLLAHYQSLADAMVTLKVQPPAGFLAKAVRAADRWRALDKDAGDASRAVARILQRLGERDLGWDYLTTPVALSPNEAGPWVELAQTLTHKGDLDLAERAYAAAFAAEPTNAQILWDRTQNLRQAGQAVQARQLFRQIADGRWQPRFQGLQAQARLQIQGGS